MEITQQYFLLVLLALTIQPTPKNISTIDFMEESVPEFYEMIS